MEIEAQVVLVITRLTLVDGSLFSSTNSQNSVADSLPAFITPICCNFYFIL